MKNNTVESGELVQAAPGWKVLIEGERGGQPSRMNYIVAAFAVVDGADSRRRLSPVLFNEDVEGLLLEEIESELQSSGFAVKKSNLYFNNERAVEKGRV